MASELVYFVDGIREGLAWCANDQQPKLAMVTHFGISRSVYCASTQMGLACSLHGEDSIYFNLNCEDIGVPEGAWKIVASNFTILDTWRSGKSKSTADPKWISFGVQGIIAPSVQRAFDNYHSKPPGADFELLIRPPGW